MMASIRFFKLFDMLARMGYKKTDLKTCLLYTSRCV